MKRTNTITTNSQMSNLVGLWAFIRDEHEAIRSTVFIFGKADEFRFLVQWISALDGSPNVIKIVSIDDMLEWDFFDSAEMVNFARMKEMETGRRYFKANLWQSQ